MRRRLADTAAPGSIRSAEYKLIGRLNLSTILTAIGDGHDRPVSPVFSKPGEGAAPIRRLTGALYAPFRRASPSATGPPLKIGVILVVS